MTNSNLFCSRFYSLPAAGKPPDSEPYAEKIVARHRAEEIAVKRKIDEIKTPPTKVTPYISSAIREIQNVRNGATK